ncbi:MAG: hypothetical protein ACT4OX_15570 [Actinomycetota bacterium]
MTGRRIAYLMATITIAASGYYFFVYLMRWEWNRALTSGVILLAAEIGLVGALVLDRIGKLRANLVPVSPHRSEPRPEVLARIRESAPAHHNHFDWLRPDRSNVFVPVLLGAGVLFSGIAWIVERLARATAGKSMERGLALQLEGLAPPTELIARHADPLALFAPPRARTS